MVNQQRQDRLHIGDAVSVPFGRKWLSGTVIERTKSNGSSKVLVSVAVPGGEGADEMLSTYNVDVIRLPDAAR
jgi:hypothetical protein